MAIQWIKKESPLTENVQHLISILNVSETIAVLLAQRGIDDFDKAKDFFRPSLKSLHDPFLMKDMDKAVDRIKKAIENNENIMVYGDYDVDGTTSVSLVYTYLLRYYKNITHYVPDRYKEGYGISIEGIDYAATNDISLIIALDCGIKAIEQINYANDKKIDFIICDHHLPGDILPNAYAVLDPKRKDCIYPFKELSGCGVGFKLIQALQSIFKKDEDFLYSFLDLVVVSIAADIVPINGENRILAHYGLKILNTSPRLGLSLLCPPEKNGNLNISNIVFNIAPKINAAGRIKHATDAVNLLNSNNKISARKYISEINKLNAQRKDIDQNITEEALKILEEDCLDKSTNIVYQPHWHKGVIGIVASRLTEVHYKPTVVFTKGDDGNLVASVRSVKGFDVYEALCECADLFERFGGHMYAAGLSMKEGNLPIFKKKFDEIVKNKIKPSQKTPSIEIDMEISFEEITPKFVRILNQFQPYGPSNHNPLFLTKDVHFGGYDKLLGKNNEHIKFRVFTPSVRKTFPVIAFNMGDLLPKIKEKPFDIVYSIEENLWQGKSHLQLRIRDLKIKD